MAGLNNTPSFNRNTETPSNKTGKGFHTRTIFSFAPTDSAYRIDGNTEWTESSLGDGIGDTISNTDTYHGDAKLPGKYWRPGKAIRIRAVFRVVQAAFPAQDTYFNVRFGLKEFGVAGNSEVLAIQNNDNNHVVVPQLVDTAVNSAVEVCGIISCRDIQDTSTDPVTNDFFAYGYYRYTIDRNNPRYIPVYRGTPFVNLADDYYNNDTRPMINCYGTVVGRLELARLSVEELA